MRTLAELTPRWSTDNASIPDRLQVLLEQFCYAAQDEGIRIVPYDDKAPLLKFRSLPESSQQAIFDAFCHYYGVCAEVRAEGRSIVGSDDRQALWRVLRRLQLTPCSDLFDRLERDDVVEIYRGSDFIQVYRNLLFLDLCSYPMDHIFSHAWHELFHRDNAFNQQLFELTGKVLGGEIRCTTEVNQPEHVIHEIFSREKRAFRVRHGIISPLFDQTHRPAAFVFTLKAKIVAGFDIN